MGKSEHRSGVTYQRELVRCSKPDCQRLHGPYWYGYWKQGRRTRKKYVGKKFRWLRADETDGRRSTDWLEKRRTPLLGEEEDGDEE